MWQWLLKLLDKIFGGGDGKPPVIEPTPPPVEEVLDTNRVLRTRGTYLTLLDGTPFHLDMGVQCCDAIPEVENSRWPLASESQIDFFKSYGLNAVAFRLGPFYAGPDDESEWTDIGGPYLGEKPQVTLQPNQAFTDKVKAIVQYAYDKEFWVEVNIIDTWYAKHASTSQGFNDVKMPWPQSDINAVGINMTQVQETYLRYWVKALGAFPNIIWATDNEGSNIRGTKREWYTAVYNIIRDEEVNNGYPIHLVGTNNESFGDGPFEYVSTHAKAALTAPIWGKFSLNNERNPAFPPNQEVNNFKQAREAGLSYAFWRAGMTNEEAYATLEGFRAVIKGDPVTTGCYAPDGEDPLWDPNPANRSGFIPDGNVKAAVNAAKDKLGPMSGAGHDAMLLALAAELRAAGFCASKSSDAVLVQRTDNPKYYEEYHAVAYATNTWSQNDQVLPKMRWFYTGTPTKPGECPDTVPTVERLDCRMQQAYGLVDCTPKANGQPIKPEGDPSRAACEKKAMEPLGGNPTYALEQESGNLTLEAVPGNPMQVIVRGKGVGTVKGYFPKSSLNYVNPGTNGLKVVKS